MVTLYSLKPLWHISQSVNLIFYSSDPFPSGATLQSTALAIV